MADEKRREAFASLSSRFKKSKENKSILVRPPYNEDLSLFHKLCTECEDTPCVAICEEDIIKIGKDKIPYLVFKDDGCTFCRECADACPSDVLVLNDNSIDKVNAKFSIDTGSCLAWNDVMCSSCRDACDEDAVVFFGVFRPTIDMDRCTACGFCYGVCPVYAVKFEPTKEK